MASVCADNKISSIKKSEAIHPSIRRIHSSLYQTNEDQES
jgi:hypothetical protein